ncbi:transposase [Streptomyces sp. NBC_01104]|nr:transposase [Streptomyces sp. NBC_01104]
MWPWRQLIDGIRFRVRTGVPRRDVPGGYGPWGRIYDLFRRWQRDGTWHRSSPDQCGWERAADCAGARAGRGRPSTSVRDGRRGGSGGGESLGLGAVTGVWRGWCWSAREGFRQGGRPARLAALGDGGDVCALEGVVGVAHQTRSATPFPRCRVQSCGQLARCYCRRTEGRQLRGASEGRRRRLPSTERDVMKRPYRRSMRRSIRRHPRGPSGPSTRRPLTYHRSVVCSRCCPGGGHGDSGRACRCSRRRGVVDELSSLEVTRRGHPPRPGHTSIAREAGMTWRAVVVQAFVSPIGEYPRAAAHVSSTCSTYRRPLACLTCRGHPA